MTLASAAGEKNHEICYRSLKECLFYPLNWKSSWKWAQTYCSDHGGNLVSIDNVEKQKAVSRFVEEINFDVDILIGARRQLHEWTWVNHISLTDVNVWNQSKSSHFRVKAAITKDNTIEARHSGDSLPYVCRYNVASARCKDTTNTTYYFERRSSCFVFYSDELLTWYDARNKCLSKGGDLATLVSVESNVDIGKLATRPHWIGLRSSWWTWSDGSEVRFSNWQRGEPDNASKMCVVISKKNSWMWKTADCSEERLLFICQKPGPGYPPVCEIIIIAGVFFCLCINRGRISRCNLCHRRRVFLPPY